MNFIIKFAFFFILFFNTCLASVDLVDKEYKDQTVGNNNQLIPIGIDEIDLQPINNPNFDDSVNINILNEEPVVSVAVGNEVRAYPIRYLLWHNVINDIIAEKPIAITYSPLTNIASVFDRKMSNGDVLSFKDSAKRFKSNLVMKDKENNDLWLQYDGRSLSQKNKKLTKIPVQIIAFEIFKTYYKDGKVMTQPNFAQPYGMNPYKYYDSLAYPFFYDGEFKRENISPMDYVIIVEDEAWSLEFVKKYRAFYKDNINIQWIYGQNSVLDNPDISKAKDIGNVIVKEIYEKDKIRDIPYMISFAYVFDAFNPDKKIYTP